MPLYNFEFIDDRRMPGEEDDTGTYPVQCLDYPRCDMLITELSTRPVVDDALAAREFDQTDGEGSPYQYQVAILSVSEDEKPTEQVLDQVICRCWHWWLSCYLL